MYEFNFHCLGFNEPMNTFVSKDFSGDSLKYIVKVLPTQNKVLGVQHLALFQVKHSWQYLNTSRGLPKVTQEVKNG